MSDELRAVGWSVLVIEDKPLEKTSTGVMLAKMSRLPPCSGRIYSVGEGARKEHPELQPGLRIHFKPFGGRDLVWRGMKMRALGREDTLAILHSSP